MVQWNAPSGQVNDPVTFYAAGNEANGDSSSYVCIIPLFFHRLRLLT